MPEPQGETNHRLLRLNAGKSTIDYNVKSLKLIPQVPAPCFPGWPRGSVCCRDVHCVCRHSVSCDAYTSSPPDRFYSAPPEAGQQ